MWWIIAAVGGAFALFVAARRASTSTDFVAFDPRTGRGVAFGSEGYEIDAQRPYGPRFRATRPPGLPPSARRAGKVGTAEPYIRRAVSSQGGSDSFLEAMLRLARNESAASMGRPADTFDARSPASGAGGALAARPPGKALITAWGVFQFNRDAWRALPGVSSDAFPWEANVRDEVGTPIVKYKTIWDRAKSAGAPDRYAERAVRLWQIAPAGVNGFIDRGRLGNWDAAWLATTIQSGHGNVAREIVDRKLRA